MLEEIKARAEKYRHKEDCDAVYIEQYLADVEELLAENKSLRNELCFKCGLYREAHRGVCNGCRWRRENA